MLGSLVMRTSRKNKKRTNKATSIWSSPKQFWYGSITLILICLGYWCWYKLHDGHTFPIKSVKIEGHYRYLDHKELQNIVLNYVNKGFFAVDLPALKNNLQQISWISQTTVWRVWPATLIIHVTEKRAVARWGNESLITGQGQVFMPSKNSFPQGLPEFSGPVGSQLVMLEAYRQMNAILAPLKIKIAKMVLSSRQSWKVQLHNGVEVILGREAIYPRLSRFVEVYPQLFDSGRINNVNYIDTRYANGISVHWKQAEVKSALATADTNIKKKQVIAHHKEQKNKELKKHDVVVLND